MNHLNTPFRLEPEIYFDFERASEMVQWVRAFPSQAEGLMFESKPRQTSLKQVVTAPLPNARH